MSHFKILEHFLNFFCPCPPLNIKREGAHAAALELGEEPGEGDNYDRWEIPPALERKMRDVARQLRKNPTPSEAILWEALRKRQLDGRKFRRQMAIGPFVVDFYCSAERLAVEVDGPIHQTQQEADQTRQELIESLGIRFVRITAKEVDQNLPQTLNTIRAAFLPSPLVGEGPGKGGSKGETVIAWLWARTVKCPNPACGARMPLVSSFELSKKKGRRAWVEPQIDRQAKTVRFTVKSGKGKAPDPPKVGRGAKFRCLVCEEIAPDQHIKDEGMAGRMSAQLMAIVTEGKSGRSYYAPTSEHEQIAASAKPKWEPQGELAHEPRAIWCKLYGLIDFADLFTPRQLTALTTFSDLVAEARKQIEADALATGMNDEATPLRDGGNGAKAYAEAVSVYLTFAIGRLSNRGATICVWNTGGEKIEQVFARQAIPMTWDFPEANPFSSSTGNWIGNMDWISKSLESLPYSQLSGAVNQIDAPKLEKSKAIAISTDPPYYDNIGYADLSDFFYIWMRSSLIGVYPEIFGTMLVPKIPELIAAPYRFDGDLEIANEHFETGLNQVFANLRHIILPDYPLTVYYAFKQQEVVIEEGRASTGWETMLTGLIETGFQIVGTWPMRTERNTGVKSNVNALASSIVLVCRPRPENAPMTSRREFVNALRRELPPALREMQSGNIAPVDLAQASIGPGMAVYSRYSKVLEPDGSRLTVRTALQLINHELDAYLAEQEGVIDADSRFAVAWFEQFGFKEAGFGQADVLARAKNTSVNGLANAGILEAGAGKVRLIPWDELDPGWDPANDSRLTTWEATHHLIERLNTYGEEGAARLLANMSPELAAEARQLAYRLYSICERKGWADHARDYNALVISWSTSQERATEFREQYQQGSLFG